jgi:hypothetical protein
VHSRRESVVNVSAGVNRRGEDFLTPVKVLSIRCAPIFVGVRIEEPKGCRCLLGHRLAGSSAAGVSASDSQFLLSMTLF